jgi:transketolase
MRRVGMADTFGESGPNATLLEKYGLTAQHIAAAARALVGTAAAH